MVNRTDEPEHRTPDREAPTNLPTPQTELRRSSRLRGSPPNDEQEPREESELQMLRRMMLNQQEMMQKQQESMQRQQETVQQLAQQVNLLSGQASTANAPATMQENLEHEAQQEEEEDREIDSDEELEEYVGNLIDTNTRIGRAITQFTKITKTVKKPMTLAGASNYLAWSKAILKVARQVGVEKIILERQETSPRPERLKISQYWNVQNNWLHGLIDSTISAQAREHFEESDSLSAYKLWEAVRTAFQERPEIQRESLLTELVRMTPQSAGSERNYIERFLAIRGEFERLGFKQLDHTLHDILKMNITSRWREFIQNRFDMACQSGTNLPEKDLEGLLKDILHRIPKKDQKKGGSTKPNTNATSSDPQKSYKNTNSESNPEKSSLQNWNCYICGKPGHLAKFCKSNKNSKPNEPKEDSKGKGKETTTVATDKIHSVHEAAFSMKEARESTDKWILDSGAGSHATSRTDLVQMDPKSHATQLLMANGSKSVTRGFGTASIQTDNGELSIGGVRIVPDLQVNLISFGKLIRDGFTVEQLYVDGEHIFLLESADKTQSFEAVLNEDDILVLRTPRIRNLLAYAFPVPTKLLEPCYVTATLENKDRDDALLAPNHLAKTPEIKEDTMANWHKRWGHLNAHDIAILARDPRMAMRIKGVKKLGFCETCAKAKQARNPFEPRTRSTKPGAKIFIDIAGGGRTLSTDSDPPSYGGAKYFLLITDDATRYRWIYLLKERVEAPETLKNWINMIEVSTERKVGTILSDGAPELTSQQLAEFYRSKGIQQEITCPYTPQQDGTSERGIRLLCERTRSVLIDSGLPNELWGEALATVSMMVNLSPTSVPLYGCKNTKPLTPFEAWTGHQPHCRWVHRWGCDAYVKILNESSKLQPRSKKVKFVGYRGMHTYRLWDPETNSIMISRDVIFDEKLDQIPTNSLTEAEYVELPEEYDYIDPLNGWQHKLLAYLAKEKPEIMKKLADGELEALEPTYLGEEQEILSDATEEEEANGAELPVLSTRTDIPKSIAEAKRSEEWLYWKEALDVEVSKLQEKGTWILVEKEPQMQILSGKWVFDRKLNNTGGTVRFKARWVVRGFEQQEGVHYKKTYAAVVSGPTTRAFFAISTAKNWKVRVFDFVTAFLNGTLPEDERVYVQLPTGFKHGRGNLVGLLRQGLYGLKQAARLWYQAATGYLKSLGFQISPYDAGLLYHKRKQIYLTLHVDDCRIMGPNEAEIEWLIEKLQERFEIKEVTEQGRYLGMRVQKQPNGDLFVNQEQYIEDLLTEYGMEDCKPSKTPMKKGISIEFAPDQTLKDGVDEQATPTNYRKGLGSLQFLVTCTRPDIAFAVNYLARFNSRPNRESWAAFKQILRYLKGTKSKGIVFKRDMDPEGLKPAASSDSDWAGADPAYKSTSGYIITMNGAPISWRSQRQTSVSKSTTEAEYLAASEAACELVWINDLLIDAGVISEGSAKLRSSKLSVDNKGAVDLAKAEAITRRARHIEIRHHMLRDWVQKDEISIEHVGTDANKADGLTKALAMDPYAQFVSAIGVTS
ncbi:copia-like retrotransposon family protein [Coccidioides posadasii C735 delta SOWgp]|uniref:Copia-like retrotransposon family protein n=1 Tax=Coccidioides posadasii (strain C735) TaxID=222929 RepID=C5P3M7_COCP7|nr:copia-like retrotransposon family protein [Coccidioides posadasii C735 delta SOWgp]EER28295.1 copia-like retrotransposon family protein [Coccidioides posadasii C735 delta SOWgp]|eukprot:XP_003070440.1 copia-like retrotransposon family protein [Coccidioides posadasii C735 delta SOWgp]